MKSFLFLVIILGSTSVFAQSAKKVNKQLRAELISEMRRQDSAYTAFLKERTRLEDLRSAIQKKIKTSLSSEERYVKRAAFSLNYTVAILRDLGFDPKALTSDSIMPSNRYPTSRELVKSQKEALNEYVNFELELRDGSGLDQHKTKEQNLLLTEVISSYKDKFEFNRNYYRQQQEYITALEAFNLQIDSLIMLNKDLVFRLDNGNQVLTGKLDELKANYKLKGPKGFPAAYKRHFPDVHPELVKEIPEVELSEITHAGYDDNVGIIGDEPVQEPVPDSYNYRNQEPVIYEIVDQQAEFPGGIEGLKKYLSDNLVYPSKAKDAGIMGKVFLRFVISEKGEVSNVKIMRGVPDCPECDKEALRIVKSMPNWIPGKINGKAVNSYFNLPVMFKL